jgi:RimJ/RimL family protein N-acetyltransferase
MDKKQMKMSIPLFEGEQVYLGAINPEQDAPVEAGWTLGGEFLRMLGEDLVRPLSSAEIKKRYREIEKEMDEKRNQFYFTIRRSSPGESENQDCLLGFVRLSRVEWNHGVATISMGIGDSSDRRKGYGRDALSLMLHYAFKELNLFRLNANIPGYNQAGLHLFEKAGFKEEARRREAYRWAGSRWDGIFLGLLKEDWEQ